jgi:predicted CXXCH cytochrome family protein
MRIQQLVVSVGRCCVLLASLFMVLSGCSRQARHEVLTFFFTGVPPLGDAAAPAQQTGAAPAGDTRRQLEQDLDHAEKSGTMRSPKPPQKPQYYSHPVWLEGQCDTCHQGKNLFVFQTPKAGGTPAGQRVFFSGGGMPGPLRGSVDKLCSGCHADKTGLRAIRDHLWLHNPTAKGNCLACHDPHQSKFSGVLRRPVEQLCQSCHSEAALAAMPLHRTDGRPCLDCHNPHMGKDRSMLRQEYQEQKQPVVGKPQGV